MEYVNQVIELITLRVKMWILLSLKEEGCEVIEEREVVTVRVQKLTTATK